MVWIDLIYNLCLLVALSVISGFLAERWKRNTRLGALLQGVVFSGAAAIGMLRPFVFAPGIMFDGRSVMVSLGALFFGPWTAAVACLMTIPLRMVLGGPGATTGVLVILASAAIGVGFHRRRRRGISEASVGALLGFGVVVHLAMLAAQVSLPPDMILPVLKRIAWPVMLTYPLATVLIGKILSDQAARSSFLEALRASEVRYRRLFESAKDGILILDAQTGMVVDVNPFLTDLLGLPRERFLEEEVWELGPLKDVVANQQKFTELREKGYVRYANLPLETADGRRIDVEFVSNTYLVNHHKVIQCNIRDITERKKTDQAFHENLARLDLALRSSGMGAFEWDIASNKRYWDATVHQLLGTRPEAFTGTPDEFFRIMHPDDRRCVENDLKKALDGGDYETFYRVFWPNGSLHYIASRGKVLRDEANRPVRMLGVCWDVTERRRAEDTLRLAHERLRRFVDANIVGVLIADPTGRVYEANDYYLHMIGFTREELEHGKVDWRVLTPPKWLPADERAIRELYECGRCTPYEKEYVRRDGARVSVFLVDMLLPGPEEQIVAFALDITTRKQAEEALRNGEERLRSLLESAPEGIFVQSQGRFVYLNPAMRGLLGASKSEELLGTDFMERVAPEYRQTVRDRIQFQQDTGTPAALMDQEYLRLDGSRVPVETTAVAIQYQGTDAHLVFVRDITDRRQAENTLRESEERFRTLVESVTDYTYRVMIRNGQVVATIHGPGCLGVTGCSPEEFHAQPELWFRMAHAEDQPAVFDWASRLSSGQKVGPLEHRIIHKNGEIRWVRNTAVPRFDRSGRCVGYEGLIQDVTGYRRLQEQFAQAQKMEAIGLLAGGVAHDFRNQLTIIKGYGEMLMRRALVKEEGREKLEQILHAVDRSVTTTGQLLAFGRQQPLRPEIVNVDSVAGGIVKSLALTLGEDIRLSVVPCAGLWSIRADAIQFQQMLLNLVLNAHDAMPQGGQLTIESGNIVLDDAFVQQHVGSAAGRYVVVKVSDTGTGMTPETLSHIFEPFFTTKPMGEGTGLGLAMVHGFVGQSGGFIDVQSQPGRGTTFRLYFPAIDAAGAASQRPPSSDLPRGRATILVVEDEDAIRQVLLETLGECGHTVLTAANAQEAIVLTDSVRQEIDLLITDVVMPDWSGPELARHFQAARPGAAVLLISGHAGDALAGHGVVPPDVNLLIKPFSSQTLTETVEKVLG